MTYQLSRFRLASIGDRAARFNDLVTDLTSADGEPTDSILWLRNGGGKSSLLSLFFALLLPLRKDFMGRAVKRQLEDYVASGDTSHTVGEWVARSENALLPAQRLITGAVYEWVDRRKPVDPDRDRDKLKAWYYSFFAVPGVLELEQLPVTDDTGRRRPRAEFIEQLREIAASRPQEFLFTITEQRGAWMETLTSRGLDPALFGYQKEMNHSEGGVAELFNFPTTGRFVDFLIDLTVDSAQPDLVAANLRKIIDVLGRKPDLLVDRDFCGEMAEKLDVLAEQHRLAMEAEREASGARLAAARLAGALRSAAAAQQKDADWFAEERERLRKDATRLDSDRNRMNDVANEFFRVAAGHRRTAAEAAWTEAKGEAGTAKDESLAWEAVQSLAEQVEAERAASAVRAQLAEEEQKTAPLREQRDEAAAALKGRYESLADVESGDEAEAVEAAEEADSSAEQETVIADNRREKATEATVNATAVRGQVIQIEEAIEVAVSRGDLADAGVSPTAAVAQARAERRTTDEELGAVRTRRAERPELRKSLAERAIRAVSDRATKVGERDQITTEKTKLAARVDALATDARLAELTQLEDGGRLNLWAEAADLRAALTHAASTAESAIVDTRVDAADDNRALEGLRTDDFLPSTRDAQRAAEYLVAAGVSARPGWHLLRDLVTESERAAVLEKAQVAELAAGVVVADADADVAWGLVEGGGWRPVAHVTLSTASQLQAALNSAAPDWCVFPNDPALFDPAAADSGRVEREARRQEQDQRIDVLHEQATADRALLAMLESLLQDCPADHLDALEKLIEAYDAAIEELEATKRSLDGQVEQLDRDDTADAAREKELARQIELLAGKIERLDSLAGQVSELPSLQKAIEQFDKDAVEHRAAADEASGRARELRATAQGARDRASGHKANRQRYLSSAREIVLLDAGRQAVDSRELLSVLRDRFKDLDARWHAVASQSVLAERLNGLTDRVGRAKRALSAYEAAVQARAAELLETADGQDAERRDHARSRSREAADVAQRRLSTTENELRQATDELKQRTPKDRPRHAQLEVEPATEDDARRLGNAEAGRATEVSGQVTALRGDAEEAGTAAAEASTAAQVFEQQANRLRDAALPAVVPDDVPAYTDDDAEAQLEQRLNELKTAVEQATVTARAVDSAVGGVRRLASEARFAKIPDAFRDRFTADESDVLAALAAARSAELRLRRTTIQGQLDDIGRDQRLVVVEVAAMVRDVLSTLDAAQRHSKLPGTLGGWGNEHFLRIRFNRLSSEEELHARIDNVVDRIVAENSKPEGLTLLKRCVHEAVAPRGFAVKVLKPNSDLAVEPVEVTQLGKFSGGEKLTVCVALYCTLARLRAVNRGRGKGALGGTLVLDNPLGTASHVALLRLQRDVAAAHGVQLVYTTGVEDLGAVGQFPNVLRLRNAPGVLRTRRYVVLDDGITSARLNREEEGAP
ncbi:hypothetical protein ACQHIV_24855 [Kribbella sp. GL6]|uniref:hypothetical protein n=1 Tax=Kribbella sp. GL6 TaxID=3419765 RepID=UPI003CFDFF14